MLRRGRSPYAGLEVMDNERQDRLSRKKTCFPEHPEYILLSRYIVWHLRHQLQAWLQWICGYLYDGAICAPIPIQFPSPSAHASYGDWPLRDIPQKL
jgi:hypothetical protein